MTTTTNEMGAPVNGMQTFAAPETVQWSEVSGEVVLVDLAGELLYGMDSMGTIIWLRLMEGQSAERVWHSIASEYQVEVERVRSDVSQFVSELVERGLLTPGAVTGVGV